MNGGRRELNEQIAELTAQRDAAIAEVERLRDRIGELAMRVDGLLAANTTLVHERRAATADAEHWRSHGAALERLIVDQILKADRE